LKKEKAAFPVKGGAAFLIMRKVPPISNILFFSFKHLFKYPPCHLVVFYSGSCYSIIFILSFNSTILASNSPKGFDGI
jgi:hypothetical protein